MDVHIFSLLDFLFFKGFLLNLIFKVFFIVFIGGQGAHSDSSLFVFIGF